jgi:hypothetical protein
MNVNAGLEREWVLLRNILLEDSVRKIEGRLQAKTESLQKPIAAFSSSLERIRQLCLLPDAAFCSGRSYQFTHSCAYFYEFGRPFHQSDDALEKQSAARLQGDSWYDRTEEGPVIHVDGVWGWFGQFARDPGRDFVQATRAALLSVITSAWTAFEVMAGDVWEASLNSHPGRLARLKGSKLRIARLAKMTGSEDRTDQDVVKSDGSLNLKTVADLTAGTFDLSRRMGTLLRMQQGFDTLQKIRAAYSLAFDKNSGSVDAALASRPLDNLSALRNVTVHNAAVADRRYLQRLVSQPELPQADLDQPVPISAEQVAAVVNASAAKAIDLIVSVDEWITSN